MFTEEEREEQGVKEETEDMEVLINRLAEVSEAVTLEVITHQIEADEEMARLKKDIKSGKIREETRKGQYKEIFPSLSIKHGCILRGDKLLIPAKLRPDILDLAHEGHPGQPSMLRLIRQTCWWPNLDKNVKD